MIDDLAGRVSAKVTSAKPLTQVQIGYLRKALETVSGKKVEIEHQEDATLLGGVVAQVGDIVYDNSLRTQLEKMKRAMVAK
jgi:F-type H+-transporting ATPase subunit delta